LGVKSPLQNIANWKKNMCKEKIWGNKGRWVGAEGGKELNPLGGR